MSSNAKHYDYYMVEGADVKKVIEAYDDIERRHNEILGDTMKKVGAIAFTTTRSWVLLAAVCLRALCGVRSLNFHVK